MTRKIGRELCDDDLPEVGQEWLWVDDGTPVTIKEVRRHQPIIHSLIVYLNPKFPDQPMEASLVEFLLVFKPAVELHRTGTPKD